MILSNKIDRNSVNHPLLLPCLDLYLTLSVAASTREKLPSKISLKTAPLSLPWIPLLSLASSSSANLSTSNRKHPHSFCQTPPTLLQRPAAFLWNLLATCRPLIGPLNHYCDSLAANQESTRGLMGLWHLAKQAAWKWASNGGLHNHSGVHQNGWMPKSDQVLHWIKNKND